MPTFYYAREIPFKTSEQERALHRIAFPDYGEPGWYRVNLSVRPHFKYMGADFTLSLVGKLDKA